MFVDSTMVERTVVTAGEVMHRMQSHTDMEVHMFLCLHAGDSCGSERDISGTF